MGLSVLWSSSSGDRCPSSPIILTMKMSVFRQFLYQTRVSTSASCVLDSLCVNSTNVLLLICRVSLPPLDMANEFLTKALDPRIDGDMFWNKVFSSTRGEIWLPLSTNTDQNVIIKHPVYKILKKLKFMAFSPQANYTDRATAACRRKTE
jgi:hypothetical protein